MITLYKLAGLLVWFGVLLWIFAVLRSATRLQVNDRIIFGTLEVPDDAPIRPTATWRARRAPRPSPIAMAGVRAGSVTWHSGCACSGTGSASSMC
jgi:hypothetical protein